MKIRHKSQPKIENKDAWRTDPKLLALLGPFDLDPCADNNPEHWIAKKNVTEAKPWICPVWTGRVWMNPPFTEMEHWMQKMASHRNGILLTSAEPSTERWHKWVFPLANAIFFPWGRFKFIDDSGVLQPAPNYDSCLVSYDPPGISGNKDCLMRIKRQKKEGEIRGYCVVLR